MSKDKPNDPKQPKKQPKGSGESETRDFDLNIGGATGRTTTGSAAGASTAQERSADPAADDPDSTRQPPPRRPRTERDSAFNAVDWLAEGAMGMLEELRHNDLGLPAEFWSHAYAAQREGLLAARTLLDHLVTYTEKKAGTPSKSTQRPQRRGTIQVE